MAFKFPEEHRLTKEKAKGWEYISKGILELITDSSYHSDGYFAIPAIGKKSGMKYLVRATKFDDWRIVAINIPTEGRSATWEEQHHIKNIFWSNDDVVIMVHPGTSTYVQDNTYWVHLWASEGMSLKDQEKLIPPIMSKYPFRQVPFLIRLYRAIKQRLITNK